MCTVTFIARKRGFALGMNRDEKLSRAHGLPPKSFRQAGRKILCPSEPGGGTWVAANDARVAFALINWYSIKSAESQNVVSRGEVVRAVSVTTTPTEASEIFKNLPLKRIRPFRLIGFFADTKIVTEWRWNTRFLETVQHPWKTGIWISSGFDESGAQLSRAKVFADALRQKSAGTIQWLRRLHHSHLPAHGPYCICMHREDAATVSYTEVIANRTGTKMIYRAGAPCQNRPNLKNNGPLRSRASRR